MKQKILIIGIFAFSAILFACKKSNSDIASTEQKLPSIALTSIGLVNQTGPFSSTDVILITFGASTTNTQPGTFDVAWLDASNKTVDSIHFGSWNADSTKTTGNKISYTSVSTTYPNTQVYAGSLVWKLSKLPTGNKQYTIKAYARTTDNQTSTFTVSRFITVK